MDTQQISLGPHTRVDLDHQGIWQGDQFLALSARAYQILQCLIRYPNHVLPESHLLQAGWPGELQAASDLFTQIYHLRQALEPDPHHPQFLVTRRAAGYLLDVDPACVATRPPGLSSAPA